MSKNAELVANPKERMKVLMNQTEQGILPSHPISRYYRSFNEMFRIAGVYLSEGKFEAALVLYMRFSSMVLQNIRKHPDYAHFQSNERTTVEKNLAKAVEYAEKLKPKVMVEFEHEAEELAKRLELEEKVHILIICDRILQAKLMDEAKKKSQRTVSPSSLLPFAETSSIVRPSATAESAQYDDLSYRPSHSSAPPVPIPDRSLKPKDSTSTYSDGLRPILVPSDLVDTFLARSWENTQRLIETCAILCGQLVSIVAPLDGLMLQQNNNFRITHAVIPKQKGGPDSCDTLNEEEVFQFQDSHHLITLGWIHTHPSQTAFLSSVDLHCHCSYQLMLPEAIAIVSAPKFGQTGIFRLSDRGIGIVSTCRVNGFHPHDNPESLFDKCTHVSFSDAFQANVVDLR